MRTQSEDGLIRTLWLIAVVCGTMLGMALAGVLR